MATKCDVPPVKDVFETALKRCKNSSPSTREPGGQDKPQLLSFHYESGEVLQPAAILIAQGYVPQSELPSEKDHEENTMDLIDKLKDISKRGDGRYNTIAEWGGVRYGWFKWNPNWSLSRYDDFLNEAFKKPESSLSVWPQKNVEVVACEFPLEDNGVADDKQINNAIQKQKWLKAEEIEGKDIIDFDCRLVE